MKHHVNSQAKTFILLNEQIKANSTAHQDSLPDGLWQCTYSLIRKDKTLKQLGGVFGVWVKYLSSDDESEAYIHDMLKAKFLGRIYRVSPANDSQHNWLDALAFHQMNGDMHNLKKTADRISLSWATLQQTKEYMKVVEQHYQSIGEPLPILDKFYKSQVGN
tara:strand:+ start:168 stop:653 length:486 start_codon:yes stop_codon:yes gene_type:complete